MAIKLHFKKPAETRYELAGDNKEVKELFEKRQFEAVTIMAKFRNKEGWKKWNEILDEYFVHYIADRKIGSAEMYVLEIKKKPKKIKPSEKEFEEKRKPEPDIPVFYLYVNKETWTLDKFLIQKDGGGSVAYLFSYRSLAEKYIVPQSITVYRESDEEKNEKKRDIPFEVTTITFSEYFVISE